MLQENLVWSSREADYDEVRHSCGSRNPEGVTTREQYVPDRQTEMTTEMDSRFHVNDDIIVFYLSDSFEKTSHGSTPLTMTVASHFYYHTLGVVNKKRLLPVILSGVEG